MGIGLQGAYAVQGLNDAFAQLIAQPPAERKYQDELRQREIDNQLRVRQLDENTALRKQQQDMLQQERQMNRSHQLVSELSPNQSISPETAGVLRTTGRSDLVRENPAPAGEAFVLPG